MYVFFGYLSRYGPRTSKMAFFEWFLPFCANKCYVNLKIGGSQIEGLSTSFNLIPNLSGLDRAEPSYGPGSGERPENFALTLFGVQTIYFYDAKCVFQVFWYALSDGIEKISDRATTG